MEFAQAVKRVPTVLLTVDSAVVTVCVIPHAERRVSPVEVTVVNAVATASVTPLQGKIA